MSYRVCVCARAASIDEVIVTETLASYKLLAAIGASGCSLSLRRSISPWNVTLANYGAPQALVLQRFPNSATKRPQLRVYSSRPWSNGKLI